MSKLGHFTVSELQIMILQLTYDYLRMNGLTVIYGHPVSVNPSKTEKSGSLQHGFFMIISSIFHSSLEPGIIHIWYFDPFCLRDLYLH